MPPLHGTASQFSTENEAPSFQNTLFTGRTQGIPDTAELIRTLPQKYRRKPMSVEEMEYIQVSSHSFKIKILVFFPKFYFF